LSKTIHYRWSGEIVVRFSRGCGEVLERLS
jgi:hypothetical protein